jgi:hypothetical protein
MATTGETIWASLIARKKLAVLPEREVKSAYLTFHFGRHLIFRTPEVPITEFRLLEYEWAVPNKVSPGVHLHFIFKKRGGLISEEISYKLIWPYIWKQVSHKDTSFICWFPYRPNAILAVLQRPESGKFASIQKVFLNNTSLTRLSNAKVLTPRRLFNLSLIAGVLSPKGFKPRARFQRKIRGPYKRKLASPRLNPEVRTSPFTLASESTGVAYNAIIENPETYRREWTGSTTPNFGAKKRSQLPVNPHTVYIRETDYGMGYDLRKKNIAPFNYVNAWNATGRPLTTLLMVATDSQFTTTDNAAIKKLNANANLGVQANMAQNLAQYSQTTNMIAKNAINIAKSVFLLKKGRFSAAADQLLQNDRSVGRQIRKGNPSKSKSLANNWLELQYGWKPILSDIDESMRALANYLEGSTSSQRVSGTAKLSRELKAPHWGPVGPNVYPAVGLETNTSAWSTRYACTYRVSSPVTSFLSQLGFTNPINLVWEILPWSFVADWVLPIGPFLESMSAPHGLEFISGYKTRFGRQTTSLNVSYNGKMPGDSTSDLRTYMDRYRFVVSLTRVKLDAWPVQSFPQFKNPFSTTHALNAIALVRQAFFKR